MELHWEAIDTRPFILIHDLGDRARELVNVLCLGGRPRHRRSIVEDQDEIMVS